LKNIIPYLTNGRYKTNSARMFFGVSDAEAADMGILVNL
jgi:hypothetical protein